MLPRLVAMHTHFHRRDPIRYPDRFAVFRVRFTAVLAPRFSNLNIFDKRFWSSHSATLPQASQHARLGTHVRCSTRLV